MVKGILCPSLTNSFRARSLERSYLTYSHRQRQKSLLIVNVVDLMLKVVLTVVWACRKSAEIVCLFVYVFILVFVYEMNKNNEYKLILFFCCFVKKLYQFLSTFCL